MSIRTSPTTSSAMTRTQRKAAETRQSIVNSARAIVAVEGGKNLTLDAVAERADVAVQTIYNRIGGRSALLTAVAEQAMRECRTYMDTAYDSGGPAEERLLHTINSYARFARERPHEFRILVEPPDEPVAVTQIAELTRQQNSRLAATLRQAVAEGTARPDLDVDDLATMFWATLNGLLALLWRPGGLRVDGGQLDRLLATYTATVADGLRTRPDSSDLREASTERSIYSD